MLMSGPAQAYRFLEVWYRKTGNLTARGNEMSAGDIICLERTRNYMH
jgi:hypothetical protein